MVDQFQPDLSSGVPIYRQLYDKIRSSIECGKLGTSQRLPPTRELAGLLGLNRTTISAAYALLEAEGLIEGHVGRGSFVAARSTAIQPVSFESSRPSQDHFPLSDFKVCAREVTTGPHASDVLQLGSPLGYGPLRQYLLEQAKSEGAAGPDDDILITSGCQQALDLVQRTMAAGGETVLVEDPTYHGLKNVFLRGGSRLAGVPVGEDGIDLTSLEQVLSTGRPRLLIVTPNFQNPTGATMPEHHRRELVEWATRAGVLVIENDIYGDLRYRGSDIPTLKRAPDPNSILIRSFSKIAFPGLRVGWLIGPRPLVARLAEAKRWSDLHSDQLSQAILLRFAESGRLAEHRAKVRMEGRLRLDAVLESCEASLPAGAAYTRPEGGMNAWITLPAPLDAASCLAVARSEQVSYLPGSVFSIQQDAARSFRLSFGGLSPNVIRAGLERLGRVFRSELDRVEAAEAFAGAPATV